jgi:chorismate dehydratase
MRPLRIGMISYLNILPIFKMLRGECYRPEYEFVEGYPTKLNRMLHDGEIDISPSSSVEYLKNTGEYSYLEGNSISSKGPVRSILLFSRIPIESLGGHDVMATHQSATSVALLDVLLRKYYCLDYNLSITKAPIDEAIRKHSASLSIGDEAIRLSRAALCLDVGKGDLPYRLQSINHQAFYVYDLGDLWLRQTGLPMVFALWTVKKKTLEQRGPEVETFASDLVKAREFAMEKLWDIAKTPGLILPPEDAVDYWKSIIYDLPPDCVQGLELFGQHLDELGLK